jgi:hypothetical protein
MTAAQTIRSDHFDLDALKRAHSVETVARRAGVRLISAGKELKACCPFHEDKSPSFTIYEGGQRWHCFGCSKGGDVLDFVQEWQGTDLAGAAAFLDPSAQSDSFAAIPRPAAEPAKDHAVFLKRGQAIVATFHFYDKAGSLLYRKHRVEPAADGRAKEFRYDRPGDDNTWLAGQGEARTPYRLPDLLSAPGAALYMAEGEAKADKLAAWGLLATSLKDWRPDFAPFVAGRRIIVLPDNDDAGARLADRTVSMVEAAGARPAILLLPGLPDKGDILDWTGTPKELAALVSALQGANDDGPLRIKATPFQWRDPASIPPRKWLYGRHLIRKFVSLDIAPGGLGKSSVKIVEALAMASGSPLLGKDLHEGPLRVWLYNLEDPAEESERRIHAAAQHYDLTPDQFGDRLFADSGREQPMCIAEETEGGARIVRPVSEAVIAELQARKIDVLSIDPFVSSHAISENDNRAIDMVAKEWSRIADICDCAINLVHHVRKSNGAEVTAESSRGAVSLIGAARSVVVYNRMTKEEAERAGVDPDDRGFYFRTQNDKANLAPPEGADWFRMNNVNLPNGDSVGVACRWEWPDAFEGLETRDLYKVQLAIDAADWGESVQAKDWAGNAVATTLGMDAEKDKHRIKAMLRAWVENRALKIDRRRTDKGREKPFVIVGSWVDPTTLPTSQGGVGKVG